MVSLSGCQTCLLAARRIAAVAGAGESPLDFQTMAEGREAGLMKLITQDLEPASALVKLPDSLTGATGERYSVQAHGRGRLDGWWVGWLEFPRAGTPWVLISGQETVQPNRKALELWAKGLRREYLNEVLLKAAS
jgi:hypothetical protein